MSDLHFQGIWRMDWGLGNPNKTAALIAILMIAVWGFAFIRKWGFWVALLPFTALGVCLIHTLSRGGLIALFAGLIPLIVTAPHPWPRNKLVALGVVAWVIIGTTLFLNAHLRYEQGIFHEDRSITNRLQIWRYSPQMMVDAPDGWGFGKSGSSYMEWYQPLTKSEGYRTLVNSHLTWLVEMGWPLRLAYIFGWLGVFRVCWPERRTPWFSIPLGIWIAFGVAASFSSIAESPWLWIVPGVALLAVIGYRFWNHEWFAPSRWSIPLGAALTFCGLFYLVGITHPSGIYRRDHTVFLGSTKPQVWMLPDSEALARNLARSIRRAAGIQTAANSCSVGVIIDAAHPPSLKGQRVIVVGNPTPHDQLERVYRDAAAIQMVNPGFYPQEVGFSKAPTQQPLLDLLVGEFVESPFAQAWGNMLPARILPGVGEYIPDWKPILLGTLPKGTQ